jgi:hypothetical protein
MGKDKAGCPNCGEPVEAGETMCPNCGVNLVSGESYEERIKRSRGRQKKAREGTPVGGIGLAVLFGLLLLAGFLYQGRVIKVLRTNSEEMSGYIGRLQRLEVLVDRAVGAETDSERDRFAGRARESGEALITALRETADAIDIEAAPTTDQKRRGEKPPKALRRARKTLLYNLASKAEYHLNRLPSG